MRHSSLHNFRYGIKFLAMLRKPGILQCTYRQGNFGLAYLESYGNQAYAQPTISLVVDVNKRQLEFTPGNVGGTQYAHGLRNEGCKKERIDKEMSLVKGFGKEASTFLKGNK